MLRIVFNPNPKVPMLRDAGKTIFWSVVGLICLVIVIGGLQMGGLIALPFVTHQQTLILRNSNGYITAQQQALRTFQHDYALSTSPDQKALIVQQMREIADLIPNDVQSDIRTFLATH